MADDRKLPVWVVRCDDYTTKPMTMARAEIELARTVNLGYCKLEHRIERKN